MKEFVGNEELTPMAKHDSPDLIPSDRGKSDSAVFDRAVLLERMMDDEELAFSVVEGFLDDMPTQIAELKLRIAAGDAEASGLQAHKIKGAFSAIGAENSRILALAMEEEGRHGDLVALESRVRDLEREYARLVDSLTKEFTSMKIKRVTQ